MLRRCRLTLSRALRLARLLRLLRARARRLAGRGGWLLPLTGRLGRLLGPARALFLARFGVARFGTLRWVLRQDDRSLIARRGLRGICQRNG
jgi:hypothetical protein